MRQYLCFLLAIALVFLTACTTPQALPRSAAEHLKVVTVDTAKVVTGQTIYVPIYSHVYSPDRTQVMNLAATLSVRNTDQTNPIIFTLVNYYSTNGEQIRSYLEQPVELKPLAATDFIVDRDDTTGGAGASFIVEWIAQTQVSDPVIEAVMINTAGNQGLSLISQGRVIQQRNTNAQ